MSLKDNRLMLWEMSGPLKQILDVLSGYNGRLWLRGLNAYFHQGAVKAFGWKVFNPLSFRLFESYDVLMAALKHKQGLGEISMASEMEQLLGQLNYPIPAEAVKLTILTPEDIGFRGGARLSQIEPCLESLGLAMPLSSDAAQLLLIPGSTGSDNDFPGIRFLLEKLRGVAYVGEVHFPCKILYYKCQDSRHKDMPNLLRLYCSAENKIIGLSGKVADSYEKNKEQWYDEDFLFANDDKLVFRVIK